MDGNKNYFLDFLMGTGDRNVLFEPFIHRSNSESIIWRRGDKLWNTPKEYVKTLISIAERTKSDFVFCDVRPFTRGEKDELFGLLRDYILAGHPLGVGIICDSQEDVDIADGLADCVCIYGPYVANNIPTIRMDGDIEDAIKRGDYGWFANDNAPYYLENYSDKIRILGGLGIDFVTTSSPLKIYTIVDELTRKFRGRWACGSGGMVPKENYLELASILSAFSKAR